MYHPPQIIANAMDDPPPTEFINTIMFDDIPMKKKKTVVKNRVLKKASTELRIPSLADHAEFMNH